MRKLLFVCSVLLLFTPLSATLSDDLPGCDAHALASFLRATADSLEDTGIGEGEVADQLGVVQEVVFSFQIGCLGLPAVSLRRPAPANTPSFQNCPAEGLLKNGGQPDEEERTLNRKKNRQDTADYQPVSFTTILNLPWINLAPAQYELAEGFPVAVEGYLAGARGAGPESANCHIQGSVDFH